MKMCTLLTSLPICSSPTLITRYKTYWKYGWKVSGGNNTTIKFIPAAKFGLKHVIDENVIFVLWLGEGGGVVQFNLFFRLYEPIFFIKNGTK